MRKALFATMFVLFLASSLSAAEDTCTVKVGDIAVIKYRNKQTDKDEVGYKKVLREEDGKFIYSKVNSLEEEPLRYECDLSYGSLGSGSVDVDQFLKELEGLKKVDFVDPIGWVARDSELYKQIDQKYFTKK